MKNSFGPILRQWRKQRRYSQLQLALELDISSKHVSFLETGRSTPSREMVLRICEFLYLPKREVNRGLYSAGYAPQFSELPYENEELKYVLSAVDKMLSNHMPYPALVINQDWDIVKANESAQNLFKELGFAKSKNVIEALIADKPDSTKIVNWHETILTIIFRLRYEISMQGGSERLEGLERKLSACINHKTEIENDDQIKTVLSVKVKLSDDSDTLSFFSVISQLCTVQDVAVSEYKVELMFPTDETTEKYYQRLK